MYRLRDLLSLWWVAVRGILIFLRTLREGLTLNAERGVDPIRDTGAPGKPSKLGSNTYMTQQPNHRSKDYLWICGFWHQEVKEHGDKTRKAKVRKGLLRRAKRYLFGDIQTMSPNRETEMDTSIDATPQMSLLKRIEDVESRTEAALGPFRELGRYLTNQSEDFLGQSTIDGCGATGVQPDKALEVPRILLDTDRRKIQAMVIMLMNLLQFPIDDRWPYPQLQTTILMAIHGPEGKTIMRVAKLDTGSWHNVISRKLTSSIGLKLEKYTGRAIQPLGQEISPKNQVTFSWHVSGRPLSYKTTFAVIETEWQENLEFDILLGIYEIQRVGFYLQNQAVFYIQ